MGADNVGGRSSRPRGKLEAMAGDDERKGNSPLNHPPEDPTNRVPGRPVVEQHDMRKRIVSNATPRGEATILTTGVVFRRSQHGVKSCTAGGSHLVFLHLACTCSSVLKHGEAMRLMRA